MDDRELEAALAKRAEEYRDRAHVFPIVELSPDEALAHARRLITVIWPQFGECGPRVDQATAALSRIGLPHDGRVDVFNPSGAIAALMSPAATRYPLAADERSVDRKPIVGRAEELAHMITASNVGPNDELRYESTWELKGRGVRIEGGTTPVALFEVLVAFRRYLDGLPVLGRASAHVALGAESTVTRWGVDWRRVRREPLAETAVIDPGEGARRVLDDLFWRRPEKPFTLDDFEPSSFRLGYVSLPRRRRQSVMQPAWIAILSPRARNSMGQVVAVPAAPRAFEPIGRPDKTPPVL